MKQRYRAYLREVALGVVEGWTFEEALRHASVIYGKNVRLEETNDLREEDRINGTNNKLKSKRQRI